MRYTVIIEQGEETYGAYIPDLPGCVSTGDTVEEVTANIREALVGHLAVMRESGDDIPAPTSTAITVEVALDPLAAA